MPWCLSDFITIFDISGLRCFQTRYDIFKYLVITLTKILYLWSVFLPFTQINVAFVCIFIFKIDHLYWIIFIFMFVTFLRAVFAKIISWFLPFLSIYFLIFLMQLITWNLWSLFLLLLVIWIIGTFNGPLRFNIATAVFHLTFALH